jgi:uncharacterized delta-60 repeat protein
MTCCAGNNPEKVPSATPSVSGHWSADRLLAGDQTMSFLSWLRDSKSLSARAGRTPGKTRSTRGKSRTSCKLTLKQLEDRCVPSGSLPLGDAPATDDDRWYSAEGVPPPRSYVVANTPAADHTPSPPGQAGGSGGKTSGGSIVPAPPPAIHNDNGATGTSGFVQSETTLVAFGNTVVVGFNDSGSNNISNGKFTGFSRSTDGGATFTDGGQLPTNPQGDAGDPAMARDNSFGSTGNGRIYFATLQYSGSGINVYRSDDGGNTWLAPTLGAPGSGSSDKEWIAVDNNAGPGQGNAYLLVRDFSSSKNGIYLYKSTDNGSTFGPSGGTLVASAGSGNVQGAFVAIGPNHEVYVFYFDNSTTTEYIKVVKSTNQGTSFGAPVTVATLATKGVNGDLGLSGIRNGTTAAAGFRSSAFPHAAVNPTNGQLYVTYDDRGTKPSDKGDVYFQMSSDGGTTWSTAVRVNSDATTTDQWQPTIAASSDGRRVGIFYYSRQEDPTGNNLFKYYGSLGAVSDPSNPNATVTFGTNFAVSDTPSLPEFGRDFLVNGSYMGDYNYAVATPGYFNVTWSDNRSPLSTDSTGLRMDPNVYFQKIANGLAVLSSTPASGDVTTAHPTQYVVTFLDPVNTPSPSAFTVNGQPATGITMSADGRTATFTFMTDPVPGLGTQAMAIAAGAVTRQGDNSPIQAYSASFQVTSLTVAKGVPSMTATPRTISYVVTFNDTLKAGTVNASDLSLNVGRVVSAAQTGNQATYTIGYLPASGTLTVTMPAGAVKDNSDNPNAAFAASYALGLGTFAGAPDPTFGSGGTVNIANAGALDGNGGVAVYPSTAGANAGKIVTGQGYVSGGRNIFAVFRYNPDGTPDTSFGSLGVGSTPVGVGDALVSGLALQSDGKIVVTGWAVASTRPFTDYEFATARFNVNGTLDTTFGSGGIVVTNIKSATGNSPGEDRAWAIGVQGDGKIVVAGFSEQGSTISTEDFAVVRYNTNGTLDSTFGSAGSAVTPNFGGGQDVANALAIQPDNKIVLAGQVTPSNGTPSLMAVARYTTGGQLDTTFNSTGVSTFAPAGSTNAGLVGVLVQNTGAIVASGWCTLGPQDLALARLTSLGQIDTSFGGAGTGYAVSTNMAIGRTIVQSAAGELYTSGRVDPGEPASGGTIDLGVAAFKADGTADTSFGTGGVVALDYGGTDDRGRSLAMQGDGKIVVTGISNPGGNHLLIRLMPSYPQAVAGSFAATPNPAPAGSSVTLSASFTDSNPSVTSITVYFYLEATGDGILEPGSDTPLGSAVATWDGTQWTVTLTTGALSGLGAGSYRLYAQAVDNFGIWSDPLAITFTVT